MQNPYPLYSDCVSVPTSAAGGARDVSDYDISAIPHSAVAIDMLEPRATVSRSGPPHRPSLRTLRRTPELARRALEWSLATAQRPRLEVWLVPRCSRLISIADRAKSLPTAGHRCLIVEVYLQHDRRVLRRRYLGVAAGTPRMTANRLAASDKLIAYLK
jgi:hypothetical protein